MHVASRNALLPALAILASLVCNLPAQSTQPALEVRLLNHPLFLRGAWQDNKLKFDATGNLLNHCSTRADDHCHASFTLGGVDLTNVDLQSDKLILNGTRAWVKFQPQLQRISRRDIVNIEIAAPPSGDYGPALDAIFASGFADLTPSLPDFWQAYAQKTFLKQEPSTTRQGTLPPAAPVPPGNSRILAPVVIKTVEPVPSDAAQRLNYNAIVIVNFIVGSDGKPYFPRIVTPAGLGLDEAAANAVSQYRFKPASKNGVALNVELNVQTVFRSGGSIR